MEERNRTTNILLIILLVAVLGVIGFFGYKLISEKNKIYMPELTNKSRQEAELWCNSLEGNYACSFTEDYSDSVEKGLIIYQSISANQELSTDVSFLVSLGKKISIQVPDVSSITLESFEKWANDNSLFNIAYINQNDENVPAGKIISISPNVIYDLNSTITVFVSNGKTQDDNNGIIVNPGAYKNIGEADFRKKAEALGLKPEHASSKDANSNTVEVGNIVWHGSGSYVKGETIRYGLCLGKETSIVVEPGTYIGMTLEDFTAAVKKLGEKGLIPKHKPERDAYSDTIAEGSLVWNGNGTYVDGEEISYGLSLGKETTIIVENYSGKTEEAFLEYLKLNKLTVGTRTEEYSDSYGIGTIISNDNGEIKISTKINYVVSIGKNNDIVIKSGQFVGKTEGEFIDAVKKLGLKPVHKESRDDYSEEVALGLIVWNGNGLYKQNEEISYGLSLGKPPVEMLSIRSADEYSMFVVTGDCDGTIKALKAGPFAKFSNVTYKTASSRQGVGQILSITVDGLANYEPGYYLPNTPIVITICNKQES